jgi:hypothetical protein
MFPGEQLSSACHLEVHLPTIPQVLGASAGIPQPSSEARPGSMWRFRAGTPAFWRGATASPVAAVQERQNDGIIYVGRLHPGLVKADASEEVVADMAKREKDPKGPSLQAEAVVGAGRGALIVAMGGAGWLGWGLGEARAFGGAVGSTFGFVALFLWACSIYTIRKGRILRKQYPPVPAYTWRAVRRSFFLVVLIEVLAIAFVFILANQIRRPDLWADWCAMVVGLHFLPLAKIFRAPVLGVLGVSITLWCALCWALFRSNALASRT